MMLVEQNANAALELAHHGYVMEIGRIVMDGAAETLLQSEDIQNFYLGVQEEGARENRRWKRKKTWRWSWMDASPLPPQTSINGVQFNAAPGQRPLRVDGCVTICELFQKRCAELGPRTAHREKGLRHLEILLMGRLLATRQMDRGWPCASWVCNVARLSSILSEDRKEWAWFDMGIQCVGGIASGVYTTDSASQLKYLINDSGSRFLIVEDEEQLDKFFEVEADLPDLLRVIILEDEGLHDLDHPAMHDDRGLVCSGAAGSGR